MTNTNVAKLLGRKKYLAMAIPLLMAAQVQGMEFNLGQIEGSFDSQISLGSSWRVESQSDALLKNADGTDNISNSDDGNRNFQSGDAFSQIFKASHDLQFSYQNFGGFVRGKYWYDSAIDNNSVDYGHGPTTQGAGIGGSSLVYNNPNTNLDDSNFNDLSKASGATLLDAFIYGEFEVMDMPLDVRLGKQVVSWGEGTFIRGGVNSINPIDVNAFRRPGAEIKEGLLPVNMAYANIGLTDNLSMETFYQLEFQETVIPGCGTYFSTNDYASEGCNSVSIVGGLSNIARDEDGLRKAKDDGQFGVAFRFISEALGDTEFGFYAMNVHSRAPIINGVKHGITPQEDGANYVAGVNAIYGLAAAAGIPAAALISVAGEEPAVIQTTIDALGTSNPAATGQLQAIQAGAPQNGSLSVAVGRAADSFYFVTYPEDILISGLSFATNVGSMALSGEVSHTKDMPIQINGPAIISTLLTGASVSTELQEDYESAQAGDATEGSRSFDVSQVQVTAIKFIDQFAGASRVVLIGEAGYTFVHDFASGPTDLRFGRSDIFGVPFADGTEDDGFVTESSWGYRARVVADYSDVFMGINLKPMLAWSHDVKGYAPQPGGNFVEGSQSLGLSVQATYRETYNASLAYTQYMEGDYSAVSDRDFASISVGMQF